MKKIIIIFICLCSSFFGYSSSENFLSNDTEIILSFKKIPGKKGFQAFSYRFPYDEYYISSMGKILIIEYSPTQRWKAFFGYRNNGYYKKRSRIIEINGELKKEIEKVLTPDNKLAIINNYVKIKESNAGIFLALGEMVIREDTRRLNKKLISFEEQEINFILDKKEKNEQVTFDMLYEICIKIDGDEFIFLLGSNSEKYQNKETIQFINLLNKVLKFIKK